MEADDLEEFRRYRADPRRQARNALVERHVGLADAIARRMAGSGPEREDVRQAAMIGLLKAVERFDPDRGVRFSTFAGPTIEGEIRHHFRDSSWAVRIGRRHQELARRAREESDALAVRLGRRPRVGEIAARLGEDVSDVLAALDAARAYRPDSIDASAESDGPGPAVTFGENDADLERVADLVALDELLGTLPEREREVLRLRFEERRSQSAIAERVGVSQMHVSRILRRTLDRLRDDLEP